MEWFGHFGFSYVGLIFLLLLFIPNLFWTKHMPAGYTSAGESKLLRIFEMIGQVFVTGISLCFSDFNLRPFTVRHVFLIAACVLMCLYELWWIRYFRSEKTLACFYSGFLGIPVAGATLPVLAFLLLGLYGKNLWMLLSALLLGVGHIGIHLQHKKELKG